MKKLFSLLMAATMLCALAACGNNGNDAPIQPAASAPTESSDNAAATEIPNPPDTSEPVDVPDELSASAGTDNGILVAYFTYGENASLSADVDASSSASIQLRGDGSITGNTGIVADMIADATGGELFSILTATQ